MESKKLTEVCSPKQWKTISQAEMLPEGYPVYGANGIIGYYNEYNHEDPTVLITCRGATCGTLNISKPFSYVNGNAMALDNVIDGVDEKYLYYYLQSRGLTDIISGSAQPQITIQNLTKVIVSYPSVEQQKRIVSKLDKADEIRTKKKQANEKLDEFLKSTFVDMFGNPVSNSLNLNKEVLSKIASSRLGKMLDKKQQTGEYQKKYLANFNVQWFRFDLTKLNEMDFNIADQKEFQLLENDILMCEGGEVGRCAIWKNNLSDCYFQKALHRIRCNTKYLKAEYLVFYMYLMAKQNAFDSIIGSKATIAHLTGEKLKQLKIILPSIEKQNKFAQIFVKVEAQKQKNEQVIEQMDNLFNSLSQKAFKGELTKPNVVDLLTRQVALHSKIIDKCNSHQTFGAVKLEKIFNLCDMIQELNLVPNGYYRKAAGPYVPKMRHTVEQELLQNDWVKITNQGNGKKVEYKKNANFVAYKAIYNQIFNDKNQEIENIINYFYDKDTNYCEAFSTLYMCWNDLILEGENPTKTEIIDEFKNHWAPEKQRFERIYLLEILSDMSNQGFEPQGHGVHTIESNYNHNKDQLSLQLK